MQFIEIWESCTLMISQIFAQELLSGNQIGIQQAIRDA